MNGQCSRLWLAIRFPDLPLTSLKIDGSAEKPVVVIQKKRVVFANALAEEAGAQIHMDTTTAQLVSGCEPTERDEQREQLAYAELSGFITLARRRAEKGSYEAHFEDLRFRLRSRLIIWIATLNEAISEDVATELNNAFKGRLWIGINHQLHGGEQYDFERWQLLGNAQQIPLVACGEALMHSNDRKQG